MLEEIESNGGYSSLFQSEEFFFSSDAEFRESGGVLIDSTEINPINEDMIISEERVDQRFAISEYSRYIEENSVLPWSEGMGEVTTNSGFQSCEEALTAEMIISEERVDQTSSHPCKGFIKNLEYFDDCNRAVSEVVERYLWSTSNSAWFSVDCQEFGKWKKIRAS